MTEEVRQRCFEPFFTTKGERGTGLAWAIYRIVQRHGGSISIEVSWGKDGRRHSPPGVDARERRRVAGNAAPLRPCECCSLRTNRKSAKSRRNICEVMGTLSKLPRRLQGLSDFMAAIRRRCCGSRNAGDERRSNDRGIQGDLPRHAGGIGYGFADMPMDGITEAPAGFGYAQTNHTDGLTQGDCQVLAAAPKSGRPNQAAINGS